MRRITALAILAIAILSGCERPQPPPPPPTYTVTVDGVHGRQTFSGASSVDITSYSDQVSIRWQDSTSYTTVPGARLVSMQVEDRDEVKPEREPTP